MRFDMNLSLLDDYGRTDIAQINFLHFSFTLKFPKIGSYKKMQHYAKKTILYFSSNLSLLMKLRMDDLTIVVHYSCCIHTHTHEH